MAQGTTQELSSAGSGSGNILSDLDPSQTSGMVNHVLAAISNVEKKVKSHRLLLARYFKVQEPIRMEVGPESLKWEFELASLYDRREMFITTIELMVDRKILARTRGVDPSYADSPISKLTSTCTCFEARTEPCSHLTSAVMYMRQKLSGLPTEKSWGWLSGLVSDGRDIGQRLIETLNQIKQPSTEVVETSPTRIQWRITLDNSVLHYGAKLGVVAYLQQEKKKGGWTKGRRLRSIFDQINEDAFLHPNDRMIATLMELSDTDYACSDPVALREILMLLRGHPNVVFDDDFLIPAIIQDAAMEMRIEAEGDFYKPSLFIGDQRVDTLNTSLIMSKISSDKYFALAWDRSRGRLWFSNLNDSMFQLLTEFQNVSRRKATFDQKMAEQLADIVSQPATKPIQLNLPESLAGPEQYLEPAVELHLLPSYGGTGMQAMLRVACDATTEPPVPGMEPQRLRIATPAGRFQLIRNLEEESRLADAIATQVELGKLSFDGPYTWLAENDDAALDLIQRLQDLGTNGPTVCWPRNNPMRLIGEITPQRLQVRVSSQRDWFGIEGVASLDGLDVPLAELLAALRNGRRFVPVGNGQFATISDQLRQRLTAIHDLSQSEDGAIRIARVATPVLHEALGNDISYESDEKWQSSIQRMNEARNLKPVTPSNLRADLRDYQTSGYRWLARLSHWGIGGVLADDMGLGKTVQALGVLLSRASEGPALIVAPTSVGVNWVRETQRFAPDLHPKLYREHDRQHLLETAAANDLVITSYQLLQRDADRFASRKWHTLVLDEAQFIKNFQTKTAKAVRDIESDWCLALSGTPLENHLGELWSLMRTVSPGLLGSWERFRKCFAEPIERDKDKERLEGLSRIVSPFILRRTKKEVLTELPPRTEVLRIAELSEEERKKYDAARLAALADLTQTGEGDQEPQKRIRVLAWLTRLRQLSCHPRLVDDRWTKSSAKLDMLMEIVEELREGEHRALVFSQFVQHLTIVREALDKEGITYQYLDGSTPTNKRQDAVDAFQRGEGDLFLISLKAGGTGLNLTAADYVLHLDPWWNPAVEDQATDRAHRIGQNRAVTVYRLVAKDTIEEQILSLHADKRELIAGVLDGADRAGKLSTTDLVNMIRLSQIQAGEGNG